MKRFFIFGFTAVWFILMSLAACGDSSKPTAGSKSDRSKSDWSSQSFVDDIESMKKAGEKGTTAEPAEKK